MIFDVLIILIGVAGIIYGIFKGLIRELFSILALVLGFAGVIHLYPLGIQWITHVVKHPIISQVVSLLISFVVFIAFAFVINQVGKLVRFSMKVVKLLWVDRIGGALCGVVKVILLGCIISSFLIYFLPSNSKTLRTSHFMPYFTALNDTIRILIPPNIKMIYTEKLNTLKSFWKKRKFQPKKFITILRLKKFSEKARSFARMAGRACLADFN
ncbi:MAG: CvpA family protein [bacterium]